VALDEGKGSDNYLPEFVSAVEDFQMAEDNNDNRFQQLSDSQSSSRMNFFFFFDTFGLALLYSIQWNLDMNSRFQFGPDRTEMLGAQKGDDSYIYMYCKA
jgi:hypothetical protein